jgi:hypothetical protein
VGAQAARRLRVIDSDSAKEALCHEMQLVGLVERGEKQRWRLTRKGNEWGSALCGIRIALYRRDNHHPALGRVLINAQIAAGYAFTLRLHHGNAFLRPDYGSQKLGCPRNKVRALITEGEPFD